MANKTTKLTPNGAIETRVNGVLHREDGPAFVIPGKVKMWYKNGFLHREDGPAIADLDGIEWWVDGRPHRDIGPAIDRKHYQAFYVNGFLHRKDGPAVHRSWSRNNTCYWITQYYREGLLHRRNGPAVIHSGGPVEYWINGNRIDGMLQKIRRSFKNRNQRFLNVTEGFGDELINFDYKLKAIRNPRKPSKEGFISDWRRGRLEVLGEDIIKNIEFIKGLEYFISPNSPSMINEYNEYEAAKVFLSTVNKDHLNYVLQKNKQQFW